MYDLPPTPPWINRQFEAIDLKNVEKSLEQTVQTLHVLLECTVMWILYNLWNYILGR